MQVRHVSLREVTLVTLIWPGLLTWRKPVPLSHGCWMWSQVKMGSCRGPEQADSWDVIMKQSCALRAPHPPPCRNSYVRLQHLCTNTWIQSTNVPIDIEEERPIRLMVRAAWGWGPGLGPELVPGCPADLCPCSWVPAPPRRTRRPLPSCRFLCPRSETWTLPMMPAPC